MQGFNGFPPGKTRTVAIPNLFFSELLPAIDDPVELKLILYAFWVLTQQEGEFRYLIEREILEDKLFLSGIDADPASAGEKVKNALENATSRGALLHASVEGTTGPEELYFLNTVRGRNALRAIEDGRFKYGGRDCPVALVVERPNIYTLYEQNIGPLTPMIGEQLREAERDYPAAWIEEAIRLAVERNKRNWRYVMAILERWQNEGKDRGQLKQSTKADRYRYVQGELADFIEY